MALEPTLARTSQRAATARARWRAKTTLRLLRVLLVAVAVTGVAGCDPLGSSASAKLVPIELQWDEAADGGYWPRFRGPNGDGISTETDLRTSWPEEGPELLWRVPLGEGYSGISVVGDRLFTMYGRDRSEWIASFDAGSGEELWRYRSDGLYRDGQGNGPRSTPTVDGGLVFGLSAQGMLHAVEADSGASVWSHDLVDEYRARPPTWGISTQPFVDGDLLLVNVGGRPGASIVAFDKRTGDEVWRSQDDLAGYAAPLRVDVGGLAQVVFFTGEGLVSLSPASGELYWRAPWRTSLDVNAAAPVFVAPDKVFVSSGYDKGSAIYRIKARGGRASVNEVWRNRVLRNRFSSSIYYEGHIYGFDEGIFKCVEAETGELTWRTRGFGHGSLLFADGHLIILSDGGVLALAEASPAGYAEKARARVLRGKTWTAPTLAGGRLYLRNEREMISLNMKALPGS